MRNTLINKFKTFAMLSAFVILFSSCDDSTSASEENSALKKEIFGNWEIYRKCIEKNKIDGQDYGPSYDKVGRIDTSNWIISKINTQDNIIAVYFSSNSSSFATAAWVNSSSSSDSHWLLYSSVSDPFANRIAIIMRETKITGINPLKGTVTERMYDSTNTVLKVLAKFELSGVKQ